MSNKITAEMLIETINTVCEHDAFCARVSGLGEEPDNPYYWLRWEDQEAGCWCKDEKDESGVLLYQNQGAVFKGRNKEFTTVGKLTPDFSRGGPLES